MSWENAVTDYVRQQIQGLAFEDRQHLNHLVSLEQCALHGGAKSYAGAMWLHALQQRHPVETRRIAAELAERRRELGDGFDAWLVARQSDAMSLQRLRDEAEAAITGLRAQVHAEERRLWLQAGGR